MREWMNAWIDENISKYDKINQHYFVIKNSDTLPNNDLLLSCFQNTLLALSCNNWNGEFRKTPQNIKKETRILSKTGSNTVHLSEIKFRKRLKKCD